MDPTTSTHQAQVPTEVRDPEPPTVAMHSTPAAQAAPVAAAANGQQQCPSCGTHMAPDQRYCLECGERRGTPRLPFMDGVTRHPQQAPAPPASRRRRPRLSPNSSLIAGVGTLLLALGVGVLIGRSGHDSGSSSKSPAVQVITAGGGASAAPTTTAQASAGGSSGTKKIKPKSGGGVVGADVSAAEGKPKEKLPPPTVKLGDKGHGAGYTNGKFTGDFFK